MTNEIGCVWCGYEGQAPDDWWHVPLTQNIGLGGVTAEDRICDLCWSTLSNTPGGAGDTIRSMNYVGNRILEALRADR